MDRASFQKAVELSSSRRQGDFESGLNLNKKTDSNINESREVDKGFGRRSFFRSVDALRASLQLLGMT